MTSLQPPSEQKKDRRLKELDGWRAISVLLVIAHHLGSYRFRSIIAPHLRVSSMFAGFGPLGVRVFFVISGFVICRLLILEENAYGSVSLKSFYIRRAFRILPPLVLYLGTIWLLLATGVVLEAWWGVIVAGLFLYDIRPLEVPGMAGSWMVGHTWSLAVEEQFYLTFPGAWVLLRKFGRGRVFIATFFVLVAWNVVSAIKGWNDFLGPNGRAGFGAICCGVIIATFEKRARAIARATPTLLMVVVLLTLLYHSRDYLSWKTALFESLYMPPAIGLALMFSLEHDSPLRTLLCWKPLQLIGITSYGIYLWQELFTAPPRFYFGAGKVIPNLLPLLLVIVPISYTFIERPAMRLGRKLAGRGRALHDAGAQPSLEQVVTK